MAADNNETSETADGVLFGLLMIHGSANRAEIGEKTLVASGSLLLYSRTNDPH
jgi:hypothetical protein